ncbi:MAG TPA: AAA family ATPase [Mycobacteriales bacterium]
MVLRPWRCFDGEVLLERDELLATLDAHLAAALRGQGRLVFVGGEAGVGKTALTGQFAGTATGVRILRGTADSPATAAPLGPFLDALPELEELLGTARRPFPAIRSALATTATLVVLEDLHWADEATLDLLGFLGRRLADFPVLIVGTLRDDEVTGAHPLTIVLGDLATVPGVARIHVPPLTRAAVLRLADSAGSSVDVEELFGRTQGNPFFVTEVLATGSPSLPPSVRDATLARAARLSAAARRVLDAAAVIGSGIELDLLGAVSGRRPEAIDECVEGGLLVGGGAVVGFRHELARQAVEQALPAATRVGLHAAVLEWLTRHGHVDDRRLAHHADASGNATAVLAYAPRAGDRAARLGAHREAAEHYRAALRYGYLLDAPERAALLERLSYECYLTEQTQAAVDSQAEALELHRVDGGDDRAGAALRRLSRLSWLSGRGADADRYATEALTILERLGPDPELAMAYSNLSQLRMLAGDTDAAVVWGSKAIDLARALGDRQVESHALNNVGVALMTAGRLAEGSAQLSRSLDLALAEDAHENAARAYTNLGSCWVGARRFADADRHLAAGIAYCTERDLDTWRLYMTAWLARSLAEQGRWDAARRTADEVLRRPHLLPVSRITALVVAAQIAVRRGEPGADAALDEALALAARTGESPRLVPVFTARAEAAWTAGRNIAAELDRAGDLVHESPWEIGELAWWRRLAGGSDDVPAASAEPFALMLSGRATAAAEAWAGLGSPLWQALALTGSDRDADVRDGVEMLRVLGAEATVRAVLRDLHARGRPVPRGPRPASRANPAGLTDRELEVLTLLAAGLSNADIAARLYLSRKTAGHHVSAVLRKLGEPTRSRAVAAAVRRGIVPS